MTDDELLREAKGFVYHRRECATIRSQICDCGFYELSARIDARLASGQKANCGNHEWYQGACAHCHMDVDAYNAALPPLPKG